jgi:hypothetical protein
MAVLPVAALSARWIALAGFGLDSPIEIDDSAVVVWDLSNSRHRRQPTALRAISVASQSWRERARRVRRGAPLS